MKIIRNNTKSKTLLKINKKINNKKRDIILSNNNLFFKTALIDLIDIYLLFWLIIYEEKRNLSFHSPLFTLEFLQLVIDNITWYGTVSAIKGILLPIC